MTSNLRLTGQRLRSGIWTVADLTSTYEIANLTVPNDGFSDAEYWCYSAQGSTPPQPARVSQNADLSMSDDGFYSWTSRMSYVTFDMLPVFLTAAGLTSVRSADVTVMEYTELNIAVFLTARIIKPLFPSADAVMVANGWSITWRFVRGVVIT